MEGYIIYNIWRKEKYGLFCASATALLIFLLNWIRYAYSWCQAELLICISCEISDFAKSRERLKISWKGNELFCTVIRINLYHKRTEIAPFSSTIWVFDLLIILTLLNFFSYLPVPDLKFNNKTPWTLGLEPLHHQLRITKRIRIMNTVLQWFFHKQSLRWIALLSPLYRWGNQRHKDSM